MAQRGRSLRSVLLEALEDLDKYEFERFRFFLRDRTLLGEFEVMRKDKLCTENRAELLEAMLENYGIFTIDVVKRVLREIDCNQTLHDLCQCSFDPEAIVASSQSRLQTELQTQAQTQAQTQTQTQAQTQAETEDQAFRELHVSEADAGPSGQQRTILCQDIFRGLTRRRKPIRTVLTVGGVRVLAQKVILDWAEGRAHLDVQLLLPFTFRELSLLRDRSFSLVELLHHCFRETKDLFSFQYLQLLFLCDGLDECSLPLDFSRTRVLTDPTQSASVEELLVNLIRGDLLPSARLWITTRPAAANRIPEDFVSMVTEARGYSEPQEEQRVGKRLRDEETAHVSHNKKPHSLRVCCGVSCRPQTSLRELLLNVLKELVQSDTDQELDEFVFSSEERPPPAPGGRPQGGLQTHFSPDPVGLRPGPRRLHRPQRPPQNEQEQPGKPAVHRLRS